MAMWKLQAIRVLGLLLGDSVAIPGVHGVANRNGTSDDDRQSQQNAALLAHQ
jgi:hypothetical protein